jgi:hypothetical protein
VSRVICVDGSSAEHVCDEEAISTGYWKSFVAWVHLVRDAPRQGDGHRAVLFDPFRVSEVVVHDKVLVSSQ